LAQGSGGRFDPGGVTKFWVASARAIQLAKFLEVLDAQGILVGDLAMLIDMLDTRKVDHRVQEHRGMAAGEDESISVVPIGIFWVVFEVMCPELVGHWSKRHRGSRVSAVGGLHSIHAKSSDGVDSKVADRAR
jgi:hypothetical protein